MEIKDELRVKDNLFLFTFLEEVYQRTVKEYFSEFTFEKNLSSKSDLENVIANEDTAREIFHRRGQDTKFVKYIFSNWGKIVFGDEFGRIYRTTIRDLSSQLLRNKKLKESLENIAEQNHDLLNMTVKINNRILSEKESVGLAKIDILKRINFSDFAKTTNGDVNLIANYLVRELIVKLEKNDYEKLMSFCSLDLNLREKKLIEPLIARYKKPNKILEENTEEIKKEIDSIVKQIIEKYTLKNGKLYIRAGTIKRISFNPLTITWKKRRFKDPMKYILLDYKMNYEGLFGGSLKKVDKGLYDTLMRNNLLDELKNYYKNIIGWKLSDNRGNILKTSKETKIGYDIVKQIGIEKNILLSTQRQTPDYSYDELLTILNSHNPKNPNAEIAQKKLKIILKKHVCRSYINNLWRLNGLKTHLHRLTEDKKLSIYFTYKKHYASIIFRTRNKAAKKTAIEEDVGETTVYTTVKPFLVGDLVYNIKQHIEN